MFICYCYQISPILILFYIGSQFAQFKGVSFVGYQALSMTGNTLNHLEVPFIKIHIYGYISLLIYNFKSIYTYICILFCPSNAIVINFNLGSTDFCFDWELCFPSSHPILQDPLCIPMTSIIEPHIYLFNG